VATPSNATPTRTTESHTKSGNRIFDKKSVEVLGADGKYVPYFDVETETVQENATTVQAITRTYAPGANGEKQLVQLTQEETQASANGDSSTVRKTSNPDSKRKSSSCSARGYRNKDEGTRNTGYGDHRLPQRH